MSEYLDLPKPPVVPQTANKQLYENSPLATSPVATEVSSRPDALHGQKSPNLAILREKPEHRQIVYWKALGYSNREIAKKTGYTDAWISQITRQPWFQKALLDALAEAGQTSIIDYLRVRAPDNILHLENLAYNAESESVKLAATINLLDRFLGKPVQRTESKVEVRKTEERVIDIDKAINELDEEEKKLRQRAGAGEQVAHTPIGVEGVCASAHERSEAPSGEATVILTDGQISTLGA